MKSLKEKWDKKAQHYNRYTDDPNTLESTICNYIQEAGIMLNGQHILDVGCGTGAYTLRIAQKAQTVDAVDISPAMLAILNEDAQKIGLTNITTYPSSWEAYPLEAKHYDIAIATMFPALKKDTHFQKMHDAAITKLFLGWDGKEGTELIESLFRAHHATYHPPNSASRLKQWLDSKQIPYKVITHTEEKTRIRPFEEAIQNYTWHLTARGLPPDREKIISVLKKYLNAQGEVVERAFNYFNLVIW